MGYRGGAPPWVYKQRQQELSDSYRSEIARLEQRIKELEQENLSLRKQLEEILRR